MKTMKQLSHTEKEKVCPPLNADLHHGRKGEIYRQVADVYG